MMTSQRYMAVSHQLSIKDLGELFPLCMVYGPFSPCQETVDLFKIQVDWHVLYCLKMFKATVQPKMKILSSFSHLLVVLNRYD